MVMGVDHAWQQHMFAGIEDLIARLCRRLARGKHFNDHTALHHQTASGIEVVGSEHSKGIFQPDTDRRHWPAPLKVGVQVASSVLPSLLIQGRRGSKRSREAK